MQQGGEVVAAEVAQGSGQLAVVEVGHEPSEPTVAGRQPLAQLAGIGAQQPLELLVGHAVDACAERLAAVALEQRVPAGGRT